MTKKWPCAFKRMGFTGCEYREDGLPDRAHWVPQNRIKQALRSRGLDATDIGLALWDSRVWDWVCRKHHHLADHKVIRLASDQYPDGVKEWAAEHGFYFVDSRTGWVEERPEEAA